MPELKDVVVIATSASTFACDTQKCLAAGCDGFIAKPVEAEKLLEQLRLHLGVKWVYQEARDVNVFESTATLRATAFADGVSSLAAQQSSSYFDREGTRSLALKTNVKANRKGLDHSTQNLLLAPDPEQIAALYELAMMGDIRGIQEQANLIEHSGEQFMPFAKQLRQLADRFQEKQILEFVRKYMAGNK